MHAVMRVRDFLITEQPSKPFPPIDADASIEEALAKMRDEGVARLRVMDNGTCLGITHRIDLAVHVAVHRERDSRRRKRRSTKTSGNWAPSRNGTICISAAMMQRYSAKMTSRTTASAS